jgi:hypothetical protein
VVVAEPGDEDGMEAVQSTVEPAGADDARSTRLEQVRALAEALSEGMRRNPREGEEADAAGGPPDDPFTALLAQVAARAAGDA